MGLLSAVRREFSGIVFYHRNYIQKEKLKDENDLLRNRLNDAQEVYRENARLTHILGLKEKSPYKVIAARVIARDPSNWSSVVIIDKGKKSGIKKGYVAVNFLGLAGKVAEAGVFTSKIMLVNDPHFAVSALVQRSRQEGAVSGSLGGVLTMKYLPADSDVKVNDTVVTSGLSEAYPKGLIIGTVVEIGEELSGLNRYAIIKPSVDPANIEELLVIFQ